MTGRRIPRWLAASLLTLLSAAVTFAVGEHLLLPRLPRLMIGKWLVTEGAYKGSTVELLRDGTMVSTRKKDDTTERIHGEVRLDDGVLSVTTRDGFSGKTTTDVLTVLELSPQQFVTQDESGNILLMKRQP